MKVKVEYKGREIEIEIPDEVLEEKIQETGWATKEISYYINSAGKATAYPSSGLAAKKDHLINNVNAFTDKKFAENIARYQTLDRLIRRRTAEICEPINWADINTKKWIIIYDATTLHLGTRYANTLNYGGAWFFDTEEHAKQIIEEFNADLFWYFLTFKNSAVELNNEENKFLQTQLIKFHN